MAIPSRVFTSLNEIKSEPGFTPDTPVTQSTYSHMLGVYEFPDLIVRCCYERASQKLCRQHHAYGVVAVNIDGTISVIGNCCARKYFNADTNLRRDMAKATNERGRLRRLDSVRQLIAERDVRMSNIESLARKADVATQKLEQFMEPIGDGMKHELMEMYHMESGNISVTSVHKRVGLDEHGEEFTETDRLERTIGTVRGLGVFNEARQRKLRSNQRLLTKAYDALGNIKDDISGSLLKQHQSALSVYDDIVRDYQALLKDIATFLTNDIKPFLFLTRVMSEKKVLAKHILKQHDLPNGNDRAKEIIRSQEDELKQQFKATKIEVPSWR